MEQKTDIAIVIPTSRPLVLHRALASLSSQTDKGFRVYVISWKKDERTTEIVSDFEDSLDIRYFSFDDATPSSLSALQKKPFRKCRLADLPRPGDKDHLPVTVKMVLDQTLIDSFHGCVL